MSRRKKKLSSEKRLSFVERVLRNEASVNILAKEAQVDINTIESWITLYENEESTGLLATKKTKDARKETGVLIMTLNMRKFAAMKRVGVLNT